MALTATNLTTGSSASNGPWTTASITPPSNSLILLTVTIRNGSSVNPTTPSVSGNGLTWTLINSKVFDTAGTSRKTIFLFRAMGGSPSAGTVTITQAETETNANWIIDSIPGADISGSNGSGAVVQSAVNSDETGSAAGLTVTLAAFTSTNNATYGAFVNDVPNVWTAGSGFAQVGASNAATMDAFTEFKSSNDTSVDGTFTNVAGVTTGGIAIEIKEASFFPNPNPKTIIPIIDRDNPLSAGLVWNTIPSSTSRADLVFKGTPTFLTSGTYTGNNIMGAGVLASSSTSNGGAYWPYSKAIETITDKFSLVLFLNITTITDNSHFFCIPYNSGWTSPFDVISFQNSSPTTSKLQLQYSVGGSLNGVTTTTTGWVSSGSGLIMIGVTRNGTVTRFFKNGIFIEQVAGASGNVDFGSYKTSIELMNRHHADTGEGYAGTCNFAGLWNRALLDREMESLYQNVWQLYVQPKRKLFYLPGTNYTQSFSETITLSEPSFIKASTRTLSDTITPSDTIIKANTRNLSDTSTISDTISYIQGRFQTLSDTISISDTLSYLQNRFKTFSETITISDTLINSYVYIREYLDTSTISDTISNVRGFVLSDVINIKDWLWRWHRAPQVLFSRVSLGASSFIKKTLGSSGWTEESPDVTVIDNDWS